EVLPEHLHFAEDFPQETVLGETAEVAPEAFRRPIELAALPGLLAEEPPGRGLSGVALFQLLEDLRRPSPLSGGGGGAEEAREESGVARIRRAGLLQVTQGGFELRQVRPGIGEEQAGPAHD